MNDQRRTLERFDGGSSSEAALKMIREFPAKVRGFHEIAEKSYFLPAAAGAAVFWKL
jgi:hypothetical protein